MSEAFDTQLTGEGKITVARIMRKLSPGGDVGSILNEPFNPTMNTVAYMRKPSGKDDQGYRKDK